MVDGLLVPQRSVDMKSFFVVTSVLVAIAIAVSAQGAVERSDNEPERIFQERTYKGKPLVLWLKAIRERNEDQISDAFDAVYSLGPDAWVTVPDLTRVVGAPFDAIVLGSESQEVIASKLVDIAVRSQAIEALGWIGARAAPATNTLIQWALVRRVVSGTKRNADTDELFIELVTMDAEQRMRVAGAVSRFGADSIPPVAQLLSSSDPGRRKLAVAILGQDALALAAELLRSKACNERELGLAVLKDMNIVVDRSYIDELSRQTSEDCMALTRIE